MENLNKAQTMYGDARNMQLDLEDSTVEFLLDKLFCYAKAGAKVLHSWSRNVVRKVIGTRGV